MSQIIEFESARAERRIEQIKSEMRREAMATDDLEYREWLLAMARDDFDRAQELNHSVFSKERMSA